ncbi:DUF2812 domain-containing protein [Flavonifractor sp. An100]|uniref:DUF2812 domain-containing protein n=1 Tax=Flavonifractor sp. An100 TaxID=1965538 RepID=UPI001302D32C|nr:DUF2812 domain-containing protein [Flavonifractor sp. An100]
MSTTVIRFTPVSGYDLLGLEGWLAKMAARGLLFSLTAGPFTFFERTEPRAVTVHLECAREKTDQEDEELSALYEESGWEYWGIFRKNFHVFASPVDENLTAHTDRSVLGYAIRRFFRQKLLGGLGLALINFMLLSFYYPGSYTLSVLRYYPAERLSSVLPFFLSLGGLVLTDLAYLHGLGVLLRLSRRVKRDLPLSPAPGSRLSGLAVAAATLLLGIVLVNFCTQLWDYTRPWLSLEDSGFITLTEIEGEDFRLTQDDQLNMSRISHSDTLLSPESWYFQQYGAFPHYEDGTVSLSTVPHLELYVTRYHFAFLAKQRVLEWSYYGGSDQYEILEPAYGLDQVLLLQGEKGAYLILRMDKTVLRADYRGNQDLTNYLEQFAKMIESL